MARGRRRNPKPITIGVGVAVAGVVGYLVWAIFIRKPKPLRSPITSGIPYAPQASGGNYIPPGAAQVASEVPMDDSFAATGAPYVAPPVYTAPFTQSGPSYIPPGAAPVASGG